MQERQPKADGAAAGATRSALLSRFRDIHHAGRGEHRLMIGLIEAPVEAERQEQPCLIVWLASWLQTWAVSATMFTDGIAISGGALEAAWSDVPMVFQGRDLHF
jgi:hypothetical protein